MLEIQIRQMQQEDVAQIIQIEEISFGEHHWSESSFIAEMKNHLGNYFVAIDKNTNEILGYSGYWLITQEAHITTIAVNPTLRKKGIGEILLQNMIKDAYNQDTKWFTLEVRASNIPAISLYKKYGFDSLGVRKNYYQDNNEDALIMWTENIWNSKFKDNFERLQKEFSDKASKKKLTKPVN